MFQSLLDVYFQNSQNLRISVDKDEKCTMRLEPTEEVEESSAMNGE